MHLHLSCNNFMVWFSCTWIVVSFNFILARFDCYQYSAFEFVFLQQGSNFRNCFKNCCYWIYLKYQMNMICNLKFSLKHTHIHTRACVQAFVQLHKCLTWMLSCQFCWNYSCFFCICSTCIAFQLTFNRVTWNPTESTLRGAESELITLQVLLHGVNRVQMGSMHSTS